MIRLRCRVSASLVVISSVLVTLILCPFEGQCNPVTIHYNASLATMYTYQVNPSREFVFHYPVTKDNENFVVETKVEPVNTHSNVSSRYPVIFQVRRYKNSQSWQVPFKSPAKRIYDTFNRTICIHEHSPTSVTSKEITQQTRDVVTVTVSTLNKYSAKFSLTVRNVCQLLDLDETRNVTVTPTSAYLLHFHFPQDVDEVMVVLSSEDRKCLTVSVQQPKCPFLDQEHSIQYKGSWWHTMTTKGAVTVPKDRFPAGFFLVLVLHSKDDQCLTRYDSKLLSSNPIQDYLHEGDVENIEQPRSKLVTVHIKSSLVDIPTAVSVPVIMQVIIIFGTIAICRCTRYEEKASDENTNGNDVQTTNETRPQPPNQSDTVQLPMQPVNQPSSSLQANSLLQPSPKPSTTCCNLTPKYFVTLDQLTVKPTDEELGANPILTEKHEKKSKLFCCFVIPIALYYFLPALQLVVMYLFTSHNTGNLDMCYYNFQCAYPVWIFNDFNHFISNVPYICEGILALIFVYTHNNKYTDALQKMKEKKKATCGVPSQSGISCGLAVAIIAEGLLSMSYHFCPNRSNFHHDTCFMYVAITLSALRLYHARHPKPAIGATTTFVFLGILMGLDLFAEFFDHWISVVIFSIGHAAAFLVLATQMYFLGKRRFWSKEFFGNVWIMICNNWKVDKDNKLGASRDLYHLIILEFFLNLGLIIYGICSSVNSTKNETVFDFGSHLLYILGGNTVVYLFYYLGMKRIHGEGWNRMTLFLLIISAGFWISGGVFFKTTRSSWKESPALSREHNEHCDHFYDSHDVWHILSAVALYTTLLLLEFIDINMWNEPQSMIAVF